MRDAGDVEEILETPGIPLDPAASRFLGARFRLDFARVRVHADAEAAASAEALNARAYTVGQHVVFNRAQYRPRNAAGIELIAHELAHTVQERGASLDEAGPAQRSTDPALEHEARSAAGNVLAGR